jgi:hypothetical protein
MIKRLTDEPQPLGAARPDIAFPPALEDALRRALGRMPAERYPSVVEFAREVSRVVDGMGAAATVAPTEAATQIMPARGTDAMTPLATTRVDGAAAAPTARAARPATPTTPAPRVPPPAPPRKKAPVAALALAAVALAGGGFGLFKVLGSGGEPTSGGDSTVVQDSQPSGGSPQRGTQRPSRVEPQGGTPPQPQRGGDTASAPAPPPSPTVDVDAIRRELGTLLDRVIEGAGAGDLVRLDAIKDDARLPAAVRAEAARTSAQAYFDLDAGAGGANLTRACDRLREARGLEPGNTTGQAMFLRFGC